jgi:hypothetical protein
MAGRRWPAGIALWLAADWEPALSDWHPLELLIDFGFRGACLHNYKAGRICADPSSQAR